MPLAPSEIAKEAKRLARRYRVDTGKGFRLKRFDPADTAGLEEEFKDEAKELLQRGVQRLADLLTTERSWQDQYTELLALGSSGGQFPTSNR